MSSTQQTAAVSTDRGQQSAEPSARSEQQQQQAQQQQHQASGSKIWLSATSWRVVQALWRAWKWFDVNVGWFVGLDEPKYKWAILEYERRRREEEEAIMNGSGVRSKAAQDDEMEGRPEAQGGTRPPPVQEVMLTDRPAVEGTRAAEIEVALSR